MKQITIRKGEHSIFDVARWFLSKESMTHRKLQKLCYFAEAWFILFHRQKLYNNTDFEGWVHGPVSRQLWTQYRNFGYLPIGKVKDAPKLPKRTVEHLSEVWNVYGDKDGYELSDLSHTDQAWITSRKGLGDIESGYVKLNPVEIYYDYLQYADEEVV